MAKDTYGFSPCNCSKFFCCITEEVEEITISISESSISESVISSVSSIAEPEPVEPTEVYTLTHVYASKEQLQAKVGNTTLVDSFECQSHRKNPYTRNEVSRSSDHIYSGSVVGSLTDTPINRFKSQEDPYTRNEVSRSSDQIYSGSVVGSLTDTPINRFKSQEDPYTRNEVSRSSDQIYSRTVVGSLTDTPYDRVKSQSAVFSNENDATNFRNAHSTLSVDAAGLSKKKKKKFKFPKKFKFKKKNKETYSLMQQEQQGDYMSVSQHSR